VTLVSSARAATVVFTLLTRWANQPFCVDRWRVNELRARPRAISYRAALVEIRELPTPRPAAGEVLVRTLCSGISGGTERLVYRGEVPAELALDDTIDALGGTFSYPFAYGYACVGEVAESGQAVFAFHPHQDVFAARAVN
jgi:NADPH:quinone reductase and related Zn-dependent oxidoreductases